MIQLSYWLNNIFYDVRYGLRQFRSRSGLMSVVVVSLAFSIGANTAIFSLIDTVMLSQLPVRDPKSLVLLNWESKSIPKGVVVSGHTDESKTGAVVGQSFSYPAFKQFYSDNRSFSSVMGFAPLGEVNVGPWLSGYIAHHAAVEIVTGDYFSCLGVVPRLGRMLTTSDEDPSSRHVAVISYSYWTHRLDREPSVLGKIITINRVPLTIVGVTPPAFSGIDPGRAVNIWVPISEEPALLPWGVSSPPVNRSLLLANDWWWLMVIGRLRTDATRLQGTAMLNVYFQQGIKPDPNEPSATLKPYLFLTAAGKGLDFMRNQFSKPLLILMAIVSLVLLLGCANVATLLLTSALARRHETAVRLCLGASLFRLVRQLLTESILIALIGGCAGVIVAYETTNVLSPLFYNEGLPVTLSVHMDFRVLGFTALISLFAAILFGLAPILPAMRADLTEALKAGKGHSIKPPLSGKILVVIQVALFLPLLVSAVLFIRSLNNLEHQDFGFDPHHILLFQVNPDQNGYTPSQVASVYNDLLGQIQNVPGIESATMSQETLLSGNRNNSPIVVEGDRLHATLQQRVWWNSVGPNFFSTMHIPLLLGRSINVQDRADAARVAVVNQAMSRKIFGDDNPIGRRFTFMFDPRDDYEIVGVVENAKYDELREPPPPTIYLSYLQMPMSHLGAMYFEVRSAENTRTLISTISARVHALDPNLSVSEVKTQMEQIDESLIEDRLFARGCSLFAGLAILLTFGGLYGTISYSVTSRIREIGVRMALGAQRNAIVWIFAAQSIILVSLGVFIGLPFAIGITHVFSDRLYGLHADASSLLIAICFLMVVVGSSLYFPIRRALKTNPVTALRTD